jgi:hypothetical protein
VHGFRLKRLISAPRRIKNGTVPAAPPLGSIDSHS